MTLLWVLLGIVVLGTVGQQVAERHDRARYPMPGRLVDVGDARVHVVSEGNGPLVLLDSGLGGSSIEWADVARDLSQDFTVIRYDRPGFAWSPGSECDRRAEAAARRILALLDEPAVLVGHSLGGLHVRVAAALAPEKVRGLVLVDPSHEGMLEIVERSRAAAATRGALRVAAALAPLGVGRLVGRWFAALALAEKRQPLTPAQELGAKVARALTCRTRHGIRALYLEQAALAGSCRQTAAATEPDLPRTVITAAAPSPNDRLVAARAQIGALHEQLGGHLVRAHHSGHLVPLDEPEIISATVREIAG